MSLREKINKQFNIALKSKNKTLISTLRLVLAAIKERDILNRTNENKEPVKDEEIIKVLRRMKKQRQESAVLYKKGERQELLEVEESEIKIIDTFLPEQLNEEDTKKICKETIESLGASSMKDMGKIMGSLKKKYSDSIDFSKVNIIVKSPGVSIKSPCSCESDGTASENCTVNQCTFEGGDVVVFDDYVFIGTCSGRYCRLW